MITLTQYILPHGRTQEVEVSRSPEIERIAQDILDAGFVFECEILTTGDISLTITDPDKGGASQALS